MDGYLTIKQVAEMWGVSTRRVQILCAEGKIEGAIKFGRDWAIPNDAIKPEDKRIRTGAYKNWRKENAE